MDATFTPAGEQVYKTIVGIIRPEKAVEKVSTQLDVNEMPHDKVINDIKKSLLPNPAAPIQMVDENDSDIIAIIEKALDKGVVTKKMPFWYVFEGKNYKKEEGLVSELRVNGPLLSLLKSKL